VLHFLAVCCSVLSWHWGLPLGSCVAVFESVAVCSGALQWHCGLTVGGNGSSEHLLFRVSQFAE